MQHIHLSILLSLLHFFLHEEEMIIENICVTAQLCKGNMRSINQELIVLTRLCIEGGCEKVRKKEKVTLL